MDREWSTHCIEEEFVQDFDGKIGKGKDLHVDGRIMLKWISEKQKEGDVG
jgi:hypothetical protein